MATSIDAFLDGPDKVSAFLDAPTKGASLAPDKPSSKAQYRAVTEDQSLFQNLLTGMGATVEGWRLGLQKLLGRPPTDAEVQDYRAAVEGLQGSAGPAGQFLMNMAPSALTMGGGSVIPAVAGKLATGGTSGAATVAGLSGIGGVVEGALQPTTSNESVAENAAKTGLFSAAIPLGVGGLVGGGQYLKGAISPYFSQEARQIAGGRILNNVAGDKSPAVIRALRTSQPVISPQNAGQAAVPAQSPGFSSVADIIDKINPDPGLASRTVAQAGRQATLGSFAGTPAQLDAAIAARKAAADTAYARANTIASHQRLAAEATVNPPKPIVTRPGSGVGIPTISAGAVQPIPQSPAIQKLSTNTIFNAAKSEAKRLAEARVGLPDAYAKMSPEVIADIIKDPTRSLEGLHLMKIAIDNRFKSPTVETALSKYSDSSVAGVKNSLLAAMPPEYTAARQGFQAASSDINQMQVGQKAQEILGSSLGEKEKSAALANAVKRETPLLKAAEGSTASELSQILTPTNQAKLDNVIQELHIDQQFKDLAAAGKQSTAVQKAVQGTINLPHFLNQGVILANTALRRFYGGGQARTFKELATVLQDPVLTAQIMEKATTREKNAIRFLMKAQTTAGVAAPGVALGVQQ